jgi:hypothetical protein
MLTDNELATCRADILDLMPDTCVITRSTLAAPNSRGFSDPVHVAAGTIVCRVDPFNKQRDANLLGTEFGSYRVANRAWYTLTAPWNADIQDADNVTFNSNNYEILRIFDDHSLRLVKRVLIVELENE